MKTISQHQVLKKLNKGKLKWNKWCETIEEGYFDLSDLDLSNKDLSGYNLKFINASNTNFENCKLIETDFSHSSLTKANFNNSNLTKAIFFNCDMPESILTNVVAKESDFYQALMEQSDLSNSNFENAQFAMSRLSSVKLDNSNISGIKLWDSQRTLWSIKNIVCTHSFWGELVAHLKSNYSPGEFEKLHTYTPTVKLFFENGINPIEIYSVSHLISKTQTKFNNCNLRLSEISEVGKGAVANIKIISVESGEKKQLENVLNSIPKFIRDKEIYKLQIKNETLEQIIDKFISQDSLSINVKSKNSNTIINTGKNNKLLINPKREKLVSELEKFIKHQHNSEKLENSKETAKEIVEIIKSNNPNETLLKKLSIKLNEVIIGASGSGLWSILTELLKVL
jgi:uncharacterized protein YjbI with pentapeptide repeats